MKTHINEHSQLLAQKFEQSNIKLVHQYIHKIIFEKYKKQYVTEWMGAMCVGLLDSTGLSVSTKLNDKRPIKTVEYVDLILGDGLL